MLPHIIIFGFHIPTFSLMIFIGVLSMFGVFLLNTRKKEIERASFDRMLFFLLLCLIVLYISAFFFDGLFHSIEAGRITFGGITWLGGVICAFPFAIFCFHCWVPQAKGRAVEYFSYVVPGIALGHGFGRIGCFCGGCCFGRVTDSIFGVSFPEGSSAANLDPDPNALDGRSLPVYPTQLFEAAFEFLLFIFMMVSRKKLEKYFTQIYMIAYGIFRFLLEFLRGDDRGSTGFFLSPAQIFSALMLIAGVLLILHEKGLVFKKLFAKRKTWQTEAQDYLKKKRDEQEQTHGIRVLKELFELKMQGVITEEEYNEKKKDILSRL